MGTLIYEPNRLATSETETRCVCAVPDACLYALAADLVLETEVIEVPAALLAVVVEFVLVLQELARVLAGVAPAAALLERLRAGYGLGCQDAGESYRGAVDGVDDELVPPPPADAAELSGDAVADPRGVVLLDGIDLAGYALYCGGDGDAADDRCYGGGCLV